MVHVLFCTILQRSPLAMLVGTALLVVHVLAKKYLSLFIVVSFLECSVRVEPLYSYVTAWVLLQLLLFSPSGGAYMLSCRQFHDDTMDTEMLVSPWPRSKESEHCSQCSC